MTRLYTTLPCAALTLGLLACGGTPAHTETPYRPMRGADAGTREVQVRSDASADAQASAALGCPATFAEARGGCDARGTSDCQFPEGSCYCGEPPSCSGAEREPMPPEMYSWQCDARPPAVREDGCPGMAPDEGAACSVDHACSYDFCEGPIYACVNGAWRVTDMVASPP